jgi:hypothetical protein
MGIRQTGETLAYHAARLLLLIRLCGKPRTGRSATLPGIEGRTLLAKLDFFLRYPAYLKKAAEILKKDLVDEELGLVPDNEVHSVESHMVRYLYGPWDHVYYPTLAYLIGKELVTVEMKGSTEVFRLTPTGRDVAGRLAQEQVYRDLAQRADTAYHLFNKYKGSGLKDFIYTYFPEVVNRELGAII